MGPQTQPCLYAMKVIRKSKMLRRCQEGHLRAERDFLVGAEGSLWIVPLVCSFQDNTNLYLVMDYMIGGDFLGLLLREDVLDEPVAQWYVAEMILCIEEMHKMKWIHRDIKPDNFLIGSSGHLKLSDFGLAFDGHWAHNQSYYRNHRSSLLEMASIDIIGDSQDIVEDLEMRTVESSRVPLGSQASLRDDEEQAACTEGLLTWRNRVQRRKLAKSVVGTSQYMAPEVIKEEAYDGRCDWWSVGIILYECLYGCTPFFAEDRQRTKERILAHETNLHFPNKARCSRPGTGSGRLLPAPSKVVVDLICSLLQCKEKRLCTRRYQHAETRPGRRWSTVSHAHSSLVRHVFPNDAEEIKSHDFFGGIPWSQLHMMQPPFVPLVKENQPVTKYFESERDILNGDLVSSTGYDVNMLEPSNGMLGASGRDNEKFQLGLEACLDSELCRIKEHFGSDFEKWRAERMVEVAEKRLQLGIDPRLTRRGKEKKRPLDKVLRDPVVGRETMELRKKGAFFGYTYRRPTLPSLPRGRVEKMECAGAMTRPVHSNGLMDEQKE